MKIPVWMIVMVFLGVTGALGQGYICAVGGGSENYNRWSDEPYRWMVEKAGKGLALVLHYDEGSTWLESYFKSFGAASASSLVIRNRTAANDSVNYRLVRAAKLIFFRGGDQYQYYQNWRGTLVEQAIREVFQAGGVIGGTSAGLAIVGGIDYTAANSSAASDDCIRNPFHRDVTLADDFLPFVPGVLFDSHFTKRARLGRLLAFVANWNQSNHQNIMGIGVDEHTAVCVEPSGQCFVSGAGSAIFVHARENSQLRCQANLPLFFTDWAVHALTAGFRFNLTSRELVGPAPGARSILPAPDSLRSAGAKMHFAGSETPADARDQLTGICAAAQGTPIILLTGPDGSAIKAYLDNILTCTNLSHIRLNSANPPDAAVLAQIRTANFFIIADLTVAEAKAIMVDRAEFRELLVEKFAAPGVQALWLGKSIQTAGRHLISNLETDEYNLQDGKMIAAAGLDLFNGIQFMPAAFQSDDYRENRVGGLFWQCFKSPRGLGLLLDDGSAVEIGNGRLYSRNSVPALLFDLHKVSWIDSSDYRTRSSYPPRQSAAFYGGRLNCLPSDLQGFYSLSDRNWVQATGIQRQSIDRSSPSGFKLEVFPNPGKNHFNFQLQQPMPAFDPVTLEVFNIVGQKVTQFQLNPASGRLAACWNGRDHQDNLVSAGIYFAVVRLKDELQVDKFLLSR